LIKILILHVWQTVYPTLRPNLVGAVGVICFYKFELQKAVASELTEAYGAVGAAAAGRQLRIAPPG